MVNSFLNLINLSDLYMILVLFKDILYFSANSIVFSFSLLYLTILIISSQVVMLSLIYLVYFYLIICILIYLLGFHFISLSFLSIFVGGVAVLYLFAVSLINYFIYTPKFYFEINLLVFGSFSFIFALYCIFGNLGLELIFINLKVDLFR